MMRRPMAAPEQGQTPIPANTTKLGGHLRDPIPWGYVSAYARKIARGFSQDGFAHLEEDIAQIAAARLFKNCDRIRTSWKGFLRRAVANAAYDLIGHEIRSRDRIRPDQGILDDVTCGEPGVPDLAAAAELEDKLEAMLTELDVEFGLGTRAIIELRSQKTPWKVIAESLDIPLRTCSDRHGKAEAWLRKQLSLPPRKGGDHE
jgi:RNA polymerase sigma factor (sigma-70 family)